MRTLVAIPVYNEARYVRAVLGRVLAHAPDVLVIDDILDSGNTLRFLRERFLAQRPARFATAVLLRKTIPAALGTPCEFVGFDIEDEFVVGYGLDFDGCFRNLPDVRVLHPEGGAP